VIIAVLLVLSGTLVVSTLFPSFNAAAIAIWLAIAVVVTGIITTSYLQITKSRRPPPVPHPATTMTPAERMNWRMPPLALLKPVQWSTGTKAGVLTLRGYLVVSVLLLIVKAVQLGRG
jgi:hypothetical protein